MASLNEKEISKGKSISSALSRAQKMNKRFYFLGFIILSFVLIFIKTKNIYIAFRYSLWFSLLLGVSILLDYIVVRDTLIRKSSLFYGLISLFSLSYLLTITYSVYIIRLLVFSKIISVWIPYSILMSMLVVYYGSFLIRNTVFVGLIHSAIMIGAFFREIHVTIFSISMCVLAIPNIIIASDLESKFLFVKTKDIARAYFSTFSKSFEYLENIQEMIGEEKMIPSDIFMFKNTKGQIFWIVNNYFHYGPFMSIGSSEAPKMLIKSLKNVLVFKGPATHRENISTSRKTKKIIKRIVNGAMHVKTKDLLARYYSIEKDKFRVHCVDLSGAVLCFVDITKPGYDDIPQEPLDDIISSGGVCIVDLHTSRGSHAKLYDLTRKDIETLRSLIEEALEKLKYVEYSKSKASYANIIQRDWLEDVYSGGIHAILMEIRDKKILILNFDGNNMNNDTKEFLIKYLKKKGYEPIISTTDSHEKATPLGDYYMVGDLTSHYEIQKIVDDLIKSLEENLSSTIVGYRRIIHKAKILGDNWISMLHHSLKTTKRVLILVLLQVFLIMCLLPLSFFI